MPIEPTRLIPSDRRMTGGMDVESRSAPSHELGSQAKDVEQHSLHTGFALLNFIFREGVEALCKKKSRCLVVKKLNQSRHFRCEGLLKTADGRGILNHFLVNAARTTRHRFSKLTLQIFAGHVFKGHTPHKINGRLLKDSIEHPVEGRNRWHLHA